MSIFQPKTVTPTYSAPAQTGGPIYLTDIFHEDDISSFSSMKNGGIDGAICKACEGMHADPKFSEYFQGAKNAGLLVGAYAFYNTATSQKSQADFFAGLLKNVGFSKSDIPPVYDFEKASGDFNSSDASNCETFLGEIQNMTGRLPMIYMSDSTFQALGEPSFMKNYPWWVARFGASPRNPYILWQKSESSKIAGLNNPGDLNIFNGSLDDLKAWIAKT